MTACFTPNQQPTNMEITSMVSPNSKALGVSTGSNVSCLPKLTYEDIFYRTRKTGGGYKRYGFPIQIKGMWCNSMLKVSQLDKYLRASTQQSTFSQSPSTRGDIKIVQYLGIAADEPERIARHEKKKGIVLPLVLAGWTEADCRKWCEENDLLSPIYTTATRGGCWFCHNQGVGQLRLLRKNYPDLWALLLKWDSDSPTTFKADGHTVHDYDKRFYLEDIGAISPDEPFYWRYLEKPPTKQMSIFDLYKE